MGIGGKGGGGTGGENVKLLVHVYKQLSFACRIGMLAQHGEIEMACGSGVETNRGDRKTSYVMLQNRKKLVMQIC